MNVKRPLMTDNTHKVFDLCNRTLGLMEEGFIREEVGSKVLKNLLIEIEDKRTLYPLLRDLGKYRIDFWHKVIFKKYENILDYFKEASKKDWRSEELMTLLVKDFLKMPVELKKNFYETNFVSVETKGKNNEEYVSICGTIFPEARIGTIFHNLPTIFARSRVLDDNYKLFEKICDDVKNTLNMTQSEFLDVYGAALVHCLNPPYIERNWNYLEMDKRRNFQEIFSTRFYYRDVLKELEFLHRVNSNRLPYDLQLPRSRKYLMNTVIIKKLDSVINGLAVYGFNPKEFGDNVKKVIEYMKDLNDKGHLSMFSPEIFDKKCEELSQKFNVNFQQRNKDIRTSVETDILHFTLSIKDILEGDNKRIVRKMKI